MGTPEFSVPALEALVEAGHEVAAVYSQPPRKAGRGQRERPSPVHARADALGLKVWTPRTLRDEGEQAVFAALGCDVAVVVAYGLILPRPVLEAPRQGCLNIHASLLPRWRGAAPIHRAVMAGDSETGVCIMRMEEGLDTGPVLLREAIRIGETDTTGDVSDRLSGMGARMIAEALERLPDLAEAPQGEEGVTYAAKVEKAETPIDWLRPAGDVARHANGLAPFPGAWTVRGGRRLKLLRARAVPGEGVPGTALARPGLRVACGTGVVELLEIQAEGRAKQDAAAYLHGNPVAPGDVFGG
ncbi:methionyl-tRNA formyltransferase [Hasllibacter halocynthiae]|uniref:Methionyl-tRNA formyltransferase n=2 Tax=Hasllibacter halocynthiae TaxID=595589 RepID=A0A2T0X392_9RHOB|nr:methionyl-tRNA formyltransferase [Hasllibacter halocynthiae]